MHTKLIDKCHRNPKTTQEKKAEQSAKEEGVIVRGNRRHPRLPDSYDDITVDSSKVIPYIWDDEETINKTPWKSRSKARKQWERKGNVVFKKVSSHKIERISLEEKIRKI